MEVDLTAGEYSLLHDGLTDDVSIGWVLDHLGFDIRPIPDFAARDGAFASLERLIAAGLVLVGRLEPLPGEPPATRHPLRVPRVRHVEESLTLVRERVDEACAQSEPLDWKHSAWVINTDAGSGLARSILAATQTVEVVVGGVRDARSRGNVTGRLEIAVDGLSFPGPGWTDFVLPVLPTLVGAFDLAHRGSPSTVRFMDGPFEIRFESAGNHVSVVGSQDRPGMRPRRSLVASGPWFVWANALQEATETVLNACIALGHDRDGEVANSLAGALRCLETMVSKSAKLSISP